MSVALASFPTRDAARHEPLRVMVVDDSVVIRGLIGETPSGWKLAMEHDTHHGPAMREMLRDATTLQDYEGDERVTVGFAP